jgi:hypothetical protein
MPKSSLKKQTHTQMPTKYLIFVLTILSLVSSAWSSTHQFSLEQRAHANTISFSAQDQNETVAAIVKAEKANLRDRPSESGSVLRTLNKGDLLALIDPPIGPWRESACRLL